MKAWIVKWCWIGDHVSIKDPIINILSARLSPEDVRLYVERYYASHSYSISEQIEISRYNKPNQPPYPASFDAIDGVTYLGHIVCGHNPYIEAFRADGVRADDETGALLWNSDSVKKDREKFIAAVKKNDRR